MCDHLDTLVPLSGKLISIYRRIFLLSFKNVQNTSIIYFKANYLIPSR